MLVAAVIVAADFASRAYVRDLVGKRIAAAFGLDEQPEVAVGGFSMLVQLAAGELDRVDVAARSATLGGLTGAVDATATGIPLNQSLPVESLSVGFAIGEEELDKLSDNLSGVPITSIDIDGNNILVAVGFEVFGSPVPIELAIAPGAADGQLTFEPRSISLNDATVTAEQLRRLFGGVADAVIRTQSFCIARHLPDAFKLESVEIRGELVELAVNADGAVLNEDALAATGACPTA